MGLRGVRRRRWAEAVLGKVAGLGLLMSVATPAFAADETDVVPFLHGKGAIGYRGEVINGQYERGNTRIAGQKTKRTFVDVEARFGAWYGLEAYFRTNYDTWDRVQWQSVQFQGAVPVTPDDQVERRKGITDITLGAKYAILSEKMHEGDVSTWIVETNVKIPGSYAAYPDTSGTQAESGAGTPGFEWLLKTSFSKRVRFADPYMYFFFDNRGSASSSSEGVGTFNQGDEWGTFFGTELVGFERKEDNLKFSADIGIGWRWVEPGQVPANRFLYGPDGDVANAPPGFGNVVREQGYIRYDSKIGFFYQLQKHAQARGHLTFGLPSDHYVEQYPGTFADPDQGGRVRNHVFTDFGYDFTMSGEF
jgi:hypothetical protein